MDQNKESASISNFFDGSTVCSVKQDVDSATIWLLSGLGENGAIVFNLENL